MNVPLVARYNIFKMLLLLLGALGFVIAGAWLTTIPDFKAKFWGPIGIIVFGFFGIVILRRLFDRREVLIVDENGIFDRRTLVRTIPWNRIEAIREIKMHRQTLFGLTVSEPLSFLSNSLFGRMIAAGNRSLGADVFLSATGLTTNKDELRAALKEGCASFVPRGRELEST